jgi:predicted RNA methylase
MILERALPDWKSKVQAAGNFFEIAVVIQTLFDLKQIPGQESPKDPSNYKNESSDYGLKVKGIKARERLNEQAREIIDRVKDSGALKDEDREILKQYSGRGGLTENSQFEYYTPTHVAEGLWDGMMANGFENGNVLDPCTGAGVFSATKPKGTIITGADIDPVGSKVAQLLNPDDLIKTQSFEKVVMETPDNTFDAVVGNVPFGNARGASAYDDPDYKDEKRIERYFILRALDKVRPGGLCCLVVPTNIVGAKGGQ